jgi:hypothetical protein
LLGGGFDLDPAQPLDPEALVPHLVQRRRRDVEKWLGSETPFADRKAEEARYELSRAYQSLFSDVLEYCRESIEDSRGLRAAQQRVRHWPAIAILRSVLSSPDAAAMVLGNRIGKLGGDADGQEESESTAEIDNAYRPQVLDLFRDEELADYAPTGPVDQVERIKLAVVAQLREAAGGAASGKKRRPHSKHTHQQRSDDNPCSRSAPCPCACHISLTQTGKRRHPRFDRWRRAAAGSSGVGGRERSMPVAGRRPRPAARLKWTAGRPTAPAQAPGDRS